jgi:hypothetical protein
MYANTLLTQHWNRVDTPTLFNNYTTRAHTPLPLLSNKPNTGFAPIAGYSAVLLAAAYGHLPMLRWIVGTYSVQVLHAHR